MKIDQIEKLNAERTRGKWIAPEFRLRNEDMIPIDAREELSLVNVAATNGVRHKHGAIRGRLDAKFIAAAPTITEQYIKARRFEVTEEFYHKIECEIGGDHNWGTLIGHKEVIIAALKILWAEVEGTDVDDINVGDMSTQLISST